MNYQEKVKKELEKLVTEKELSDLEVIKKALEFESLIWGK